MAESKDDEGERGEWKNWLKTQHSKKLRSCNPGPSLHVKWMGKKVEKVADFIFLGSRITADSDCCHKIKKTLAPQKKCYGNTKQCIKKQRYHIANKGPYSQSYGFSISHVQMWDLDHKENWVPKNWCFQTVVLDKILESPLDSKEIKLVNPKGNQPWIFFGRNEFAEVETEVPIFGHLMRELTRWKRTWCWERLRAREGNDRGWDGWMASLTQWTWAWANTGS